LDIVGHGHGLQKSFAVALRSAIGCRGRYPDQDIALQINKLLGQQIHYFKIFIEKQVLKNEAALGINDIFEAISHRLKVGMRVGTFPVPEHANPGDLLRLLCPRRQRPSCPGSVCCGTTPESCYT
jgi:hypothetical protein